MVRGRGHRLGISEEELGTIFEAFQRGGRGVRTSTEGTGLGLTLSKRIVELHGGRIWMESRLGEGSTFRFSIPQSTAVGVPARRSSSRNPRRRQGTCSSSRTTARSADLLKVYLEDAGYRVTVGRDGIDGLRLARELEADRGDPRHPAAAARRLGLPRRVQARRRDVGDPGRGRVDARRAQRGAGARGGRVPGQAGRPPGGAGRACALRVGIRCAGLGGKSTGDRRAAP